MEFHALKGGDTMSEGLTTAITEMTKSFTDAISGLQAPVLGILGAGVAIVVVFAVYKIGKKAFGKSIS